MLRTESGELGGTGDEDLSNLLFNLGEGEEDLELS